MCISVARSSLKAIIMFCDRKCEECVLSKKDDRSLYLLSVAKAGRAAFQKKPLASIYT